MKRVYVASPFRGSTVEETRQNIVYARMCMSDSLSRGESPYLSHLLYTQVYAEDDASREAGLKAGDAWREAAEVVAVYTDLGVTDGMRRALASSVTAVGRTIGGGALPVTVDGWRYYLAGQELEDFPALLTLDRES